MDDNNSAGPVPGDHLWQGQSLLCLGNAPHGQDLDLCLLACLITSCCKSLESSVCLSFVEHVIQKCPSYVCSIPCALVHVSSPSILLSSELSVNYYCRISGTISHAALVSPLVNIQNINVVNRSGSRPSSLMRKETEVNTLLVHLYVRAEAEAGEVQRCLLLARFAWGAEGPLVRRALGERPIRWCLQPAQLCVIARSSAYMAFLTGTALVKQQRLSYLAPMQAPHTTSWHMLSHLVPKPGGPSLAGALERAQQDVHATWACLLDGLEEDKPAITVSAVTHCPIRNISDNLQWIRIGQAVP